MPRRVSLKIKAFADPPYFAQVDYISYFDVDVSPD